MFECAQLFVNNVPPYKCRRFTTTPTLCILMRYAYYRVQVYVITTRPFYQGYGSDTSYPSKPAVKVGVIAESSACWNIITELRRLDQHRIHGHLCRR